MSFDDHLPRGIRPADVRACVGIVSDTHTPQRCPVLPEGMFDVLRGSDLILHAGDVGELAVLDRLGALAPVVAVHGNDESAEARRALPATALVTVGGRRIFMQHGHFEDPAEDRRSRDIDDWPTILEMRRRVADGTGASIMVFGHLHVPFAVPFEDVLLVNAGTVAHGHVVVRTTRPSVALLFLTEDAPHVVHVDVGTREPFDATLDLARGYWDTLEDTNHSIVPIEDWRTFWRRLRDVSHQPTWDALHALATRCWLGESEAITREDLLGELARHPDVDHALHARYASVLDELCATSEPEAGRIP